MKSLKQEIIDELQLLDHLDQFSDEDMIPRADRILKLIEKRIDSTVLAKKDEHHYSGDEEFHDGFDLGFDFAVDKMREMLLK